MFKVLAALLLLTAGPAQAERSISDLISLAMSQGEAGTLARRTAKTIGLPQNTPTKVLWFNQGVADDGNEHVFEIILQDDKPQSIRWQASKVTKDSDKTFFEGYDFHVTLAGKLKGVWLLKGPAGRLKETKLRGRAAKARFEGERKFWTVDSTRLEWSK